ncbi:unnamed protein product [Amoebophrya sp. A120]|nr:unnamed protein product [Amoebophrya sp. A120]|eukprot:GSA120T00002271001.1
MSEVTSIFYPGRRNSHLPLKLAEKFEVEKPTEIKWAHAVNTRSKLEDALQGDCHMIEADVSFGPYDENTEPSDSIWNACRGPTLPRTASTGSVNSTSSTSASGVPPAGNGTINNNSSSSSQMELIMAHPPQQPGSNLSFRKFCEKLIAHSIAVERMQRETATLGGAGNVAAAQFLESVFSQDQIERMSHWLPASPMSLSRLTSRELAFGSAPPLTTGEEDQGDDPVIVRGSLQIGGSQSSTSRAAGAAPPAKKSITSQPRSVDGDHGFWPAGTAGGSSAATATANPNESPSTSSGGGVLGSTSNDFRLVVVEDENKASAPGAGPPPPSGKEPGTNVSPSKRGTRNPPKAIRTGEEDDSAAEVRSHLDIDLESGVREPLERRDSSTVPDDGAITPNRPLTFDLDSFEHVAKELGQKAVEEAQRVARGAKKVGKDLQKKVGRALGLTLSPKGVKFDFKKSECIQAAIDIILETRLMDYVPCLMLNADIFYGPLGAPGFFAPRFIDGEFFAQQCARVPKAWLSLGWMTTDFAIRNRHYRTQIIERMLELCEKEICWDPILKRHRSLRDTVDHITFAVNAPYVLRSRKNLRSILLDNLPNSSLTVFTGTGSLGITETTLGKITTEFDDSRLFIDVKTQTWVGLLCSCFFCCGGSAASRQTISLADPESTEALRAELYQRIMRMRSVVGITADEDMDDDEELLDEVTDDEEDASQQMRVKIHDEAKIDPDHYRLSPRGGRAGVADATSGSSLATKATRAVGKYLLPATAGGGSSASSRGKYQALNENLLPAGADEEIDSTPSQSPTASTKGSASTTPAFGAAATTSSASAVSASSKTAKRPPSGTVTASAASTAASGQQVRRKFEPPPLTTSTTAAARTAAPADESTAKLLQTTSGREGGPLTPEDDDENNEKSKLLTSEEIVAPPNPRSPESKQLEGEHSALLRNNGSKDHPPTIVSSVLSMPGVVGTSSSARNVHLITSTSSKRDHHTSSSTGSMSTRSQVPTVSSQSSLLTNFEPKSPRTEFVRIESETDESNLPSSASKRRPAERDRDV